MRQGNQNNRNNRQRSRGRRPTNSSGGNQANKVYDSNGPDVRVRGSAQTVADKYLQLAGDAQSQGDRIKTESYFQYAEHYLRIVAANQAAKNQKQAEKEKAAEEHAARNKAKQEKAAAELAKKSDEANTPKPDDETTKTSGKSAPEANKDDDDDWGGHQPAFLQRDENMATEKPKKPRRKPVKSKASAKTNGDAQDDSKNDLSDDAPVSSETTSTKMDESEASETL